MKTEALHIGMKVRHPQYGVGTVKTITEKTSDIQFEGGITRTVSPETSELEPAEAQVAVTGLNQPLAVFVAETARAVLAEMGVEKPDTEVEQLGARWFKGRLVLHPGNASESKEVPLEVFFHKIVMMRNNLRVLEQKINAHEKLDDAEKVEMQQYITRCYGSMTTFNVLFRRKEDQFNT